MCGSACNKTFLVSFLFLMRKFAFSIIVLRFSDGKDQFEIKLQLARFMEGLESPKATHSLSEF